VQRIGVVNRSQLWIKCLQFIFRQVITEMNFGEVLYEADAQINSVAVFDSAEPTDGCEFREFGHCDFCPLRAYLARQLKETRLALASRALFACTATYRMANSAERREVVLVARNRHSLIADIRDREFSICPMGLSHTQCVRRYSIFLELYRDASSAPLPIPRSNTNP
jgi:hypothetical protein